MLTCFATIAAISAADNPINEESLGEIVRLSPSERLDFVVSNFAEADSNIRDVKDMYAWFLEVTDVPEEDLVEKFMDKKQIGDAFVRADCFGNKVYELVVKVAKKGGYLRYLVV